MVRYCSPVSDRVALSERAQAGRDLGRSSAPTFCFQGTRDTAEPLDEFVCCVLKSATVFVRTDHGPIQDHPCGSKNNA